MTTSSFSLLAVCVLQPGFSTTSAIFSTYTRPLCLHRKFYLTFSKTSVNFSIFRSKCILSCVWYGQRHLPSKGAFWRSCVHWCGIFLKEWIGIIGLLLSSVSSRGRSTQLAHSSYVRILEVTRVSPPHFGNVYISANIDEVKCFTSTVDGKKTYAITVIFTVLDLLTDIMGTFPSIPILNYLSTNIPSVVSIPIIVLRHSLLSRSTKFGLAIFLCLSIFMAICAIIRLAGFYYKGVEDDTWEFFWQHTEGAVSVMMASITAFRTLFVKQTNNSEENSGPHNPVESLFWHRLFKRFQALARARPTGEKSSTNSTEGGSVLKMPKMPSPIFTGMRSFIRRNNRTEGGGETFATLNSVGDGVEADYHAALIEQERGSSRKASPDTAVLKLQA